MKEENMTNDATQSVELSIHIVAPPEMVFRYFSDPQRYKSWMGEQSAIKPGPDGRLTVSFGPGPTAFGRILDWREPERIVFAWTHEGRPGSSLVTVTMVAENDGTRVMIKHEGITELAERDGTASGWRYYLSALASAVWGDRLDATAAAVIQSYLSAWAQPEPAQRYATLCACVANTVAFRDKYGAIDGCRNLSDYIGGVQKLMGLAEITSEGPLDRVHGFVRQNWKIAPDGKVLFRGQNMYEFDSACRLKLIIGYWA